MRIIPCLVLAAAVSALTGCSTARNMAEYLNPYRIDIRQGNYVDQEMVAKLKKGMSREQVRFVLGTPLVADAFHDDRWDYVYRFQKGRGEPVQRHLTVVFGNGLLDHLEGDVVAATTEGGEAPKAEVRSRVIDLGAPQVPAPPAQ